MLPWSGQLAPTREFIIILRKISIQSDNRGHRIMPLAKDNATGLSVDEYLRNEQESLIKHEYQGGRLWAMVGASDAHVTIAGNVFVALREKLGGSACRVYISDMKLRIEAADAFYYPDVFVTCHARDKASEYYKQHPCLIVEVLSPSTEAFDRGGKFAAYRQLDSLQEYLLIDSTRICVECYRRSPEGQWVLFPYDPGDKVQLRSVNLSLALSALYKDAGSLV
jgi:Uma2 family endonuclease